MSYLNGKITERLIVPVVCGTEQGTAFFIGGQQLMTARHVVRAYFASTSAPEQILLTLPDRSILCRAEELALDGKTEDVALLTIADGEEYVTSDWLTLLYDEFVDKLSLRLYGYPQELAMGERLVSLEVRNRLEIDRWNDRTLTRDDRLELKYYDGMSGSPVVNKGGRVIGVATMQNNQSLSYLSVKRLRPILDAKGVGYATDWESEDDTLMGQGRSLKQCEEAIASIHDRYMPGLHQPDRELENLLDTITDARKIEQSVKMAEELATFVSRLPQDKLDKVREDLNLYRNIDEEYLKANGYDLLEKCCDYFDDVRFRDQLNFSESLTLNQLKNNMEEAGWDYARGKTVKNVCLTGKAGTGKTHSLCHFAKNKQGQANIYLFFGTDFKPHESVIGHIRNVVCEEESFADFNQGMEEKGRYAVIIVDALNEGLGCGFWNQNLGALRSELGKHSNVKLIVSVRSPFEKELSDLTEENQWTIRPVAGFVNRNAAIDEYFRYYDIDRHYRIQTLEAFQNPLFLKMFCETFHSMTEEERRNVTKRDLYKRYVGKKNQAVSDLVDEDPEMNIADSYLSKIANVSVFYQHCNPILRQKARALAKRVCPGRLWSQDLLHACLSVSLLLDDRSADGGKAVMFEYENLGDYYKAEQLLNSKMDVGRQLDWIIEQKNYLERHPGEASHKLESAAKALFDCYYHRNVDAGSCRQVQKGGQLYDLYVEYLYESDLPFQTFYETLLRLDNDNVNPIRLIQDFDKLTLDEALQMHHKLMAYHTVGDRDIVWTRYVNQMYDMYGDEFLGTMQVEEDATVPVSDDERLYLLCVTWMLTSSHPRFRALLTRKLRKILSIHTVLIDWLQELFEDVNDPYVAEGLYCAICGVVMPLRDKLVVSPIAQRIYQRYYESNTDVPQDLLVRQWTLKIIERAYYLDKDCDGWVKIQTPFEPQPIDEGRIPEYRDVKADRGYFGLQHGSMLMHNSMFDFEDFNRYIIGTNNHHSSPDYFVPMDDGTFAGVPLTDIMAEMSFYITDVFGWNDKLGYLDNGKYSLNRSHNDKERIGKKFQWLAWYRVNARLMDGCRVSKEQYYYGDKAEEKDLAEHPYPWNTSEVSRFDPTLDPSQKYAPEAGLTGTERLTIVGVDDEKWIDKDEYLPSFRHLSQDKDGVQYVLLMGYDTTKTTSENGRKETFLFCNAAFVHRDDADQFSKWASKQNFYGRWMPEHRGSTEFMWSDYPWADTYRSFFESYEIWEQPHDCPVKMMLSYVAQLQEEWSGIDARDEFLTTVYMPCQEMMEQMGLYCSEVRGVVKAVADGSVACLNTGHGNCVNGLFIRQDVLDAYLEKNGYEMFYYVLGEKVLRLGEMNSVMRDLSAAYRYKTDGTLQDVQPMRVIPREIPKAVEPDPSRIAFLKNKNNKEGLTSREMIELASMEDGASNGDILDVLEEIEGEE